MTSLSSYFISILGILKTCPNERIMSSLQGVIKRLLKGLALLRGLRISVPVYLVYS